MPSNSRSSQLHPGYTPKAFTEGLPMLGLRLGIHVQKDFYIAYPACQLRRGRKNNVLSQGSRQADSSSFRHPCTRAVAVAVLRCFKSKQAPACSGQIAVQDFRTPIHIANTSWRLVYSNRTPCQARDRAPMNPLRWKINHI